MQVNRELGRRHTSLDVETWVLTPDSLAVRPSRGDSRQFPLDELIPYDLIETIVNVRVKQDSAKAAAKRKTTRAAHRKSP